MDHAGAFEGCNAEHVFSEVGKRVPTAETRTLWGRLQDEMKRQGVGAAISYLEGEFTRLHEEFTQEMRRTET